MIDVGKKPMNTPIAIRSYDLKGTALVEIKGVVIESLCKTSNWSTKKLVILMKRKAMKHRLRIIYLKLMEPLTFLHKRTQLA